MAATAGPNMVPGAMAAAGPAGAARVGATAVAAGAMAAVAGAMAATATDEPGYRENNP
jgi:hypothetical protein